MNISQLIQSTSYVEGYDPSSTFKKKFGEIYVFNKTVRVKPGSSIIEVSMMIKGVTDKVKSPKESSSRSVAAHKVMVSIRGVKQEVVSALDLVKKIREANPGIDASYSNVDLLKDALNGMKFFEDKTIFKNTSGTYVLVDDGISKDSEIRVWCSCSSYYWVFQYYNVQQKVDIWMKAPDKYIPKTKAGWEAFKKNKPLRNPGKHPGMCKHIMLLLALLMEDDTLSEARSIVQSYKANYKKFEKANRLTQKEYNDLIKRYQSDHRRKLNQRKISHSNFGYAAAAGSQRKNQQGWNKNLKQVQSNGNWYWRNK